MALRAGLVLEKECTVTPDMSASQRGNPGVDALSTPAVVELMEAVAVEAIRPDVRDDQISVGTKIEVSHFAPTPLGASIRVTANLTEVDGRRLRFSISVHDHQELVASATHERVVIGVEGFQDRVTGKAAALGGARA